MDPLTAVLAVSRVNGVVLSSVTARGPWGFSAPPMSAAAFHAVTAGVCYLLVDGRPPEQLLPGDVVLFPTGGPHSLVSAPGAPVVPYKTLLERHPLDANGRLDLPGEGSASRFVCAAYTYDADAAHPLLSLLPPTLLLRAGDPAIDAAVHSTVTLLAHELGVVGAGSSAVVERLIDVLFVQVVRAWLATSTDDTSASWLHALRDPAMSRVLGLIHDHPERHWTVASMARAVSMSRATLGRRFTQLVGDSPMAYLTAWRLELAARRLRETVDPVDAVARAVGYTSEYAFSRAFSRHRGIAPGRYRSRHRTAGHSAAREQAAG